MNFITHSITLFEQAQEDEEELTDDEIFDALEEQPRKKHIKTIYHDDMDMEDYEDVDY